MTKDQYTREMSRQLLLRLQMQLLDELLNEIDALPGPTQIPLALIVRELNDTIRKLID